MPSFWTKIGLAAALASQLSAGPLTFAQQPSNSAPQWTTPAPCAQPPGRARVWQPGDPSQQAPITPPPWVPSTPMTPTPTPSPMPPTPSPMPPTPTPTPSPMPPTPTPSPMTPTPTPTPSPTPQPPMAPPSITPPDAAAAAPDFSSLSAPAGIGSPEVAFSDTPNMMGDLLKGYRSVQFPYNNAGDFSPVRSAGSTTLRNTKVAENNSAVPRTRISFRYNYFNNATDVQGFQTSPQTVPVNNDLFTPFNSGNVPRVFPASRSFDAHFYTLGLEKTFWNELASLEVRIPFAHTLDSDQTFLGTREVPGTGAPAGSIVDPAFVSSTVPAPLDASPLVFPGTDVLGETDTELQDLNFILKRVLWMSRNNQVLVSGGLGLTIPTAQDVDITVVDAHDDQQGFEPPTASDPTFGTVNAFNTSAIGTAINMRRRDINVENEVWEIAPFLAFVATPTQRTFMNGFVQVDLPLNSADVTYRERRVDIFARDVFPNATATNAFGTFGPNGLEGDFTQRGKIEDQTLLHFDVGMGYWLYRNQNANFLTGLASLAEIHYTTSLEDADIVSFQPGPQPLFLSPAQRNGFAGDVENPTRVGNLANRVDYLNLTLGGVFEVANSATLAVGYVAPLRDDLDRTFDGELNVQFNLYR